MRSLPFSYCINRFSFYNSFYFQHPALTLSHDLDLSLSLSDHRFSFRSQNISYISLFLQDRRARVETIRSTETVTAVILVNKVNKNRALQLQTFTFIIMFSATFYVYIYYYFKCDISRLHLLLFQVRHFTKVTN